MYSSTLPPARDRADADHTRRHLVHRLSSCSSGFVRRRRPAPRPPRRRADVSTSSRAAADTSRGAPTARMILNSTDSLLQQLDAAGRHLFATVLSGGQSAARSRRRRPRRSFPPQTSPLSPFRRVPAGRLSRFEVLRRSPSPLDAPVTRAGWRVQAAQLARGSASWPLERAQPGRVHDFAIRVASRRGRWSLSTPLSCARPALARMSPSAASSKPSASGSGPRVATIGIDCGSSTT